jgi:hypothetical protein
MAVIIEINAEEKLSRCCGLEPMWNQMMSEGVWGGFLNRCKLLIFLVELARIELATS